LLRPWDFKISIRRSSQTPVYLQIAHALIGEIRRGRLHALKRLGAALDKLS
jgi:DNA-binding transcriptional regulator YhcF (GntR family)